MPTPSPTPTPTPTPTPSGEALLLVRKWIDLDGRPSTTDWMAAPGWAFSVTIVGGSPASAAATTDPDGWIRIPLTPGPDGAAVDVIEALPKGVRLLAASCVDATGEARGTAGRRSVRGVPVATGETVTCTFVNTSGAVSPTTPTPRATPPVTDTAPARGPVDDGAWRAAILALVALIVVLEMLTPARVLRALDRRRR